VEALITSGRIAELIIGLMVVEGLALSLYWFAKGRGVPPIDLVVNLLAGVALLLALRAALTGADWRTLAGILAVAGVLHVVDLSRRWGRKSGHW
jgi:hypothetical protein